MSRTLLFIPLLMTACTGEADKADDTAGDTNAAGCEITFESLPSSGALDADYRAPIEFHLSDPDTTATVTSADIAGTTSSPDGYETIIFTPNEPLAPSTPSTVTLNYCRGSSDITFTTSGLGAPLSSPDILETRTYALDLAGARILEPAGVGSVLTSYLTQSILVGVVSADATKIQMLGAIGKEDVTPPEQDYCDPSIDFPEADFTAQPYFQIGPQDTTLAVAGLALEIGDLEITGTFAADGTYFAGGTLAGVIDTRPLAPLLGDDSGDEGAICDLAISFGAVCEACPADGEPYCLSLVADQIQALEVEGETLVVVAGSDCTGCADGPPAEDAVCVE